MKVIINPLESIELDGKKIMLGCSREDVKSILGKPHIFESSYYYFENEIRFDFDRNNKLEFIEFLGGADGVLQPEIYGINPFTENPEKVYEVLAQHNNGDIDDSENGYSYAFVETGIGVYRTSIPEEEYIRESEDTHWSTIGLGVKGYYNYDEEKLFRVGDVKKLYNAFIALCDFVEEDVYCGKCPLWKDMCGSEDQTKATEFGKALERIRYIAGISK